MRKKIVNRDNKSELCPLFQEACKKVECAWFYEPFEKCNMEILGYNLFKVSKSIDDLLVEMKNN